MEECLRYSGPITWTVRILHEPIEFGGYTLDTNSARKLTGLATAMSVLVLKKACSSSRVSQAPCETTGFPG